MSAFVRGCLVAGGLLLMLAGLGTVVALPGAGTIPGLELVAFGAFMVVVVVIERNRYRSAEAERNNAAAGPGGGEPAGTRLEARFRPTGEVFIDPTTNQRMRVVIDPASGERRYVAEG